MHVFKKGIIAVVLIVSLLLVPSRVWAAPKNITTEEAAKVIQEVMEHILAEYAGEGVDVESLRDAALKGMFDTLDVYSEYYTPEEFLSFEEGLSGEFVGIGIEVQNKEGYIEVVAPILNTPAYEAGIQSGDRILEIDGKPVKDMPIVEALNLIKGPVGEKVTLKILRGEDIKTYTLTRARIKSAQVIARPMAQLLPELENTSSLLYVEIVQFGEGAAEELKQILKEAKANHITGIIFDVRYNPGGYLDEVIDICRMLVPRGPIVHTLTKDGKKETIYSYLPEAPFQMAVLVNGYSASASEIFAGAIQDAGAGSLIGQKTFGKGIVQQIYALESGNAYKMTVQEYLTRGGRHIHGVGILPNIVVEIPHSMERIERKLERGSKGDDVLVLKSILQFLGYKIDAANNAYDEKTVQAVYAFQKDQGLHPYGVADLTTQRKLNAALETEILGNDRELRKAVEVLIKEK